MTPFVQGLIGAAVGVGIGLGGYFLHPVLNPAQASAPQVVTRTITQTKTLPGQTIIETKETVTEKTVPPVITKVRRDWSLGLVWEPKDVLLTGNYMPAGATVGRRALGDLWGTLEFNWKQNAILLGVRYEF